MISLISHANKWCSKFSKPGFNSTSTVNFQMFKLVLEKAEEPEIKFPKSTGPSSSVYPCPLFLISFASVRSIPFLSFIVPIFAWNVPLVSLIFFKEISSFCHSLVFLYFFALITEGGFLISSCYSLELTFRWVYFSFSPLLFAFLLFTAICKPSSDSHFAFLHFFFLGMVLFPLFCTMSWTSTHSSSGTLSIRSVP